MCLIVLHVPMNRETIVECYKTLIKDENGHYITWYRSELIPNSGFLKPDRRSTKKTYYYGDRIYGGHIHAYTGKGHDSGCKKAYAFDVRAYEIVTLVCGAMYIPVADHERKKERLAYLKGPRKNLRKWLKKEFNWTLPG